MRTYLCLIVAGLLMCLIIITAGTSRAGSLTFSWLANPESDNVTGYRIHFGHRSRFYTKVIDVGLPPTVNGKVQFTIDPAPPTRLYFCVTAYNAKGLESGYSNEQVAEPEKDIDTSNRKTALSGGSGSIGN